jgi:hypothetical protein
MEGFDRKQSSPGWSKAFISTAGIEVEGADFATRTGVSMSSSAPPVRAAGRARSRPNPKDYPQHRPDRDTLTVINSFEN